MLPDCIPDLTLLAAQSGPANGYKHTKLCCNGVVESLIYLAWGWISIDFLFDGDGLRQIAWLINVRASEHGNMI